MGMHRLHCCAAAGQGMIFMEWKEKIRVSPTGLSPNRYVPFLIMLLILVLMLIPVRQCEQTVSRKWYRKFDPWLAKFTNNSKYGFVQLLYTNSFTRNF